MFSLHETIAKILFKHLKALSNCTLAQVSFIKARNNFVNK